MIKAVIVDDEYYALEGLKMELMDIGGIEIVGTFRDGEEFLEQIGCISPDIIFLDIEMPGHNGFELFERLIEKGITANIVFVTAYDHYAVKAFEINAIDYILKPATKSRLINAIQRIKSESVERPRKISINCFKHFSIMADDREINSGWRTRKAEELIAYLLCERGRFITKEKIAEDLWPGQNGEKSLANLYLAYYYIKKQERNTGVKIPVESERGKMRIDPNQIECDLLEFCRLKEESERNGISNAIPMMEKAVELYQGTLLEDAYYSWTGSAQQHYEIQYLKLLNQLTEYYRRLPDETKARYYGDKRNVI